MHLEEDFTVIYHGNLKGNARTAGERRRREAGNVFQDAIRVGVGITVLVRRNGKRPASIWYHPVDDYLSSEKKLDILGTADRAAGLSFQRLLPDSKHLWITEGQRPDFEGLLPMGTKAAKADRARSEPVAFNLFSLGVASNRDTWAYSFQRRTVRENVTRLIANYNNEVARYSAIGGEGESFVNKDEHFIKWTDRLQEALIRGERLAVDAPRIP